MLPLFFQVVLLESPAKAGARLIVPSLATPIGGVIAGFTMSKYGRLAWLVRWGTLFMTLGNLLVASLEFTDSNWKYFVYLFPANLGLGMTNPSLLFSFISAFEHRGNQFAILLVQLLTCSRASRRDIDRVPHSLAWNNLRCDLHFCHRAERAGGSIARSLEGY
jgi:hypothetical protein